MKLISFVLSGLLLAMLASVSYAQSLGELAKKEQERRQAMKAQTKVITNDQAAKAQTGPVTTTTQSAAAPSDKAAAAKPAAGEGEKPDAAGAKTTEKPVSEEPVDFEGRTESFWRQTFADARKKVSDLENQTTAIILKINDLQNRFYRESDGYKQQEIQREIQKTFYEQDLNKQNLEQAKEILIDLEKEARKSGALPGWIK
jgi:hypothetical protein